MQTEAQQRRPPLLLATLTWVALILSITLQRSLPSLPHAATTAAEALGALGCLLLLLPRESPLPDAAELRLLRWMLLVPTLATLLAASRGQYGNMASPAISALALLAFGRLDRRTRGESAWRALAVLVSLSVVLGVVDRSVVEPNERSFLRLLYDGRLLGVLQTPNVLGESAVLLAVLSFAAKDGRARIYGIGLAVFAILAASSQTAAAAVAAALILWAVWRVTGNAGLVLAGWLASTVVVGLLLWAFIRPQSPAHSFGELWSGITFSNRTNVWTLLLSYHVPFTGLGQNAFANIFATHVIVGATGVSSAHDVGIDAYMRDGWLGVAALAAAFYAIIRFVTARRNLLALAALAAFMLESFLEVTPSHAPYYALFFTAITAAGAPYQRPGSGTGAFGSPIASLAHAPAGVPR